MMNRRIIAGFFVVAGQFALSASRAYADIESEVVASGLDWPVTASSAPGDFNRLFILEKRGRIKIINLSTGTVNATPFLNIDSLVVNPTSFSDERGLLGLAFHPNYASNGFFYVYYINNSSNSVLARYSVSGNPDIADPGSALIMLGISQPQTNHNGGCLQFGPDGMLYLGTGDGGGANDQHGSFGNAQALNTLLGKMLRFDVDAGAPFIPADNPFVGAGDPLDEIWSYGLRNPWRFSFDRSNGNFYIADVGQNQIEEINFRSSSSTGGENYGWRCMEGNNCFISPSGPNCTCNDASLVDPIHTYSHTGGNVSITGGYVYRGSALDGEQGNYFYGDYGSGRTWSLRVVGGVATDITERTSELGVLSLLTSFGEDAAGELYILREGSGANSGQVLKIVSGCVGGTPDCNGNGIADSCDIADCAGDPACGDCDNNGVPDECDIDNCSGQAACSDCNNNGTPDFCDILDGGSDDCNFNGIPDECPGCAADCECDDGNPCTDNDCNGGTCSFPPVSCPMGQVCNPANGDCDCLSDANCPSGQHCNTSNGDCQQCVTGSHCVDGNPCTDDRCIGGFCSNPPMVCDLGQQCDPADGVCKDCLNNGDCPAGEVCDPSDGTCKDCLTEADCDPGQICDSENVCRDCQVNGDCDDGLFCNGAETCDLENGCQPGTPVDCDDGVSCTVDSCNEDTDSCDHLPDDAACDNGLFCDGVESCDLQSGCVAGSSPCDPPESCDEALDKCNACASDAECDDGDVCTFDRCTNSTCTNQDAPFGDRMSAGGVCGPDGDVDIFDIFGVLDTFVDNVPEGCSESDFDIKSSEGCTPDGAVDIFDIFGVLDAFAQNQDCCALP